MNFVIQEEKEFRAVEVGTYTARLNKIEEKPPTAANPDWGPSLMFEFVVLDDGPSKGDTVAAFTPAVPKTGNGLGKLLKQMMGRALKPGEQLDGNNLINRPFTIFVDFNKTGTRTRVVSAVPLKSQAPPAPAPAPVAPLPPAAQKLAAALAQSPAASVPPPPPPAPAPRLTAQTQQDFQDTSRWAHFSVEGQGQEMQIQEMRQRISQGAVALENVLAYIPATAEWIPFAAVDLPF